MVSGKFFMNNITHTEGGKELNQIVASSYSNGLRRDDRGFGFFVWWFVKGFPYHLTLLRTGPRDVYCIMEFEVISGIFD
jgi:hypothetical protein